LGIKGQHATPRPPKLIPSQYIPQNQIITVSGPRRIFTPRPVTQRANRPHIVRLGRIGQVAWLMVDNLQNVSSKSPGQLSQLNTRSLLYLGKLKLWHEIISTPTVSSKMHSQWTQLLYHQPYEPCTVTTLRSVLGLSIITLVTLKRNRMLDAQGSLFRTKPDLKDDPLCDVSGGF